MLSRRDTGREHPILPHSACNDPGICNGETRKREADAYPRGRNGAHWDRIGLYGGKSST